MPDELLEYYERELTYLRRMGAEFAKRYPKVAGRLQLEPAKSEDDEEEEGAAALLTREQVEARARAGGSKNLFARTGYLMRAIIQGKPIRARGCISLKIEATLYPHL